MDAVLKQQSRFTLYKWHRWAQKAGSKKEALDNNSHTRALTPNINQYRTRAKTRLLRTRGWAQDGTGLSAPRRPGRPRSCPAGRRDPKRDAKRSRGRRPGPPPRGTARRGPPTWASWSSARTVPRSLYLACGKRGGRWGGRRAGKPRSGGGAAPHGPAAPGERGSHRGAPCAARPGRRPRRPLTSASFFLATAPAPTPRRCIPAPPPAARLPTSSPRDARRRRGAGPARPRLAEGPGRAGGGGCGGRASAPGAGAALREEPGGGRGRAPGGAPVRGVPAPRGAPAASGRAQRPPERGATLRSLVRNDAFCKKSTLVTCSSPSPNEA